MRQWRLLLEKGDIEGKEQEWRGCAAWRARGGGAATGGEVEAKSKNEERDLWLMQLMQKSRKMDSLRYPLNFHIGVMAFSPRR
jgi:hypothetical protein